MRLLCLCLLISSSVLAQPPDKESRLPWLILEAIHEDSTDLESDIIDFKILRGASLKLYIIHPDCSEVLVEEYSSTGAEVENLYLPANDTEYLLVASFGDGYTIAKEHIWYRPPIPNPKVTGFNACDMSLVVELILHKRN